MNALLAIAAVVALASTLAVVVQRRAVHALLYLIVSFFSLAVAMLALGAAFAAALEVVVYAGAILVLFVFVLMMLGSDGPLPGIRAWIGPTILSLVLLAELVYAFLRRPDLVVPMIPTASLVPKDLGLALFGPYAICTEIAAFLLLAGLVGAFRIGRRDPPRAQGGSA